MDIADVDIDGVTSIRVGMSDKASIDTARVIGAMDVTGTCTPQTEMLFS